jgi:hypothetical protein
MFGHNQDEQPVHEVTQTWRAGQESADAIQKIHSACCTCGWVSPEGNFQQTLMAIGAHEAAAEQSTRTPGLAEFAGVR